MGRRCLRIMWEVDDLRPFRGPLIQRFLDLDLFITQLYKAKKGLWNANLLSLSLVPMPLKMLINESLLQTLVTNLLLLKLFCQESRELLTREGVVREVFSHSMNVC